MKVVDNRETVKFINTQVGNFFVYHDKFYVRTETLTDPAELTVNAINIDTGYSTFIKDSEEVERVNAELVIK